MEAKTLLMDVVKDHVKKEGFLTGFALAAFLCLAGALYIIFMQQELLVKVAGNSMVTDYEVLKIRYERMQEDNARMEKKTSKIMENMKKKEEELNTIKESLVMKESELQQATGKYNVFMSLEEEFNDLFGNIILTMYSNYDIMKSTIAKYKNLEEQDQAVIAVAAEHLDSYFDVLRTAFAEADANKDSKDGKAASTPQGLPPK